MVLTQRDRELSYTHSVGGPNMATKRLLVCVFLNLLFHTANCFTGDALHGKLTEAAIQVSDLLRMYHQHNLTPLEPHMISLALVSLRLAGHKPNTILSDFKINSSFTAVDSLKGYLDQHQRKYSDLSMIPAGQMAYIVQGTLALCLDPESFYGHNLAKALVDSFSRYSKKLKCCNYFEYSVVGLALCHSKTTVPRWAVKRWIKHTELAENKRCTCRSYSGMPDITAMKIMALSCLQKNFQQSNWNKKKLEKTLNYLIKTILTFQKDKRSFGNIHSTSLAVQALMTVVRGRKPKHWHWKDVMRSMLEKQDDKGSFGDVLANILILPALLGRSLVNLSDLSCPPENFSPPQVENKKNISVCLKLSFRDDENCGRSIHPVNLTVPENSTAFDILTLTAAKNSAYKFDFKEYSFGRMITAIAGVKQDPDKSLYWFIYADESSLAPDGADIFKPKDKACVIFRYEKYGQGQTQCDVQKS